MADVKNMPAPLGAAIDPFEDYEDGLTPHARAMDDRLSLIHI